MSLWAWFVDLKLREVVLETWSLTYSINIYIYSQGLQPQEPQISDRLGISQKLTHLTSCLWQKNPGFRKNSLCSLIWPDFDSFESADWPLNSSTNFRIWWKICFCLWSAQVAYSKASQEYSFRYKFELAGPKRDIHGGIVFKLQDFFSFFFSLIKHHRQYYYYTLLHFITP